MKKLLALIITIIFVFGVWGTASAILIAKNKEGALIVNTKIGKTLGAQIPFAMIQSAAQVIE